MWKFGNKDIGVLNCAQDFLRYLNDLERCTRMYYLKEAINSDVERLEKESKKISDKIEKLEKDLEKRNSLLSKKLLNFDKKKQNGLLKIEKAVKTEKNTSAEVLKIADTFIEKIVKAEPSLLKTTDWPQYSPTSLARELLDLIVKMKEICAKEFNGDFSLIKDSVVLETESLYFDLTDIAWGISDDRQKAEYLKKELAELEERRQKTEAKLGDMKETREYLDYAPPEFWKFVENYTKDTIEYYKKNNWTVTLLTNTGKEISLPVKESDIRQSINSAAKETIFRVSKKLGRIISVRNLEAGSELRNFDGYYVCERGESPVYTILAGGYNIQKEHTRVIFGKRF